MITEGKAQAENYADSLRKMSHLAFYDEGFENHARNPKILDAIESLLGPDIKLYQDQLFMKPPRIGSRQGYHQDMPLGFYIDPPDMVTCWAALTDSTIKNGCVWMLPGTHKFGITEKSEWAEYEQMSIGGSSSRGASVRVKGRRLQLPPRSHSSQQSSQPDKPETARLRNPLRQCQVSIYGSAGKGERCDANARQINAGVHLKDLSLSVCPLRNIVGWVER